MSTTRARKTARPRITYVVIVKTGEVSIAVYGPYRSFKRAEGDAKAPKVRKIAGVGNVDAITKSVFDALK